jgi:outer membrane receptor protein involved in Fe transport
MFGRRFASPQQAAILRIQALWRGLSWALIHALVVSAMTMSAFAQETPKDLSEVSLEELSNIQVYTASKHLQSASEAPASVSVVTADEIQKYGYRNLADILRSVSGFYVTSDRNYTFVGVRGFGRLGDWNSRILVLIDGHRINNNVLGEAMLGNEFLVDVDMIERVEIVRGPSSSLYGANAFFAVINVITRTNKQVKDWELSFQAGSFDTYEGRATYGHQFHGLGVLLSGTFYNSQGQTLFFPEFNNPATNNGITSGTDYESYTHILATLTFHGFTLQGLFATRDKGVPTAYFGIQRSRGFQHRQPSVRQPRLPAPDREMGTGGEHELRPGSFAGAGSRGSAYARRAGCAEHLLSPGKLVDGKCQSKPRTL